MSLKEILLSLLAISIVVLFPHTGLIPIWFGYSIPILIFVWLWLKRTKENFTDIGFSFKRFELKSFFVAAVAAVFIFSFLNWVFFPLLEKLVNLEPANLADFTSIKGNTGFYIFMLLMSWLVGGFYEEIVFHGFIFTRIEKMITGKYALVISFLITNTIFAAYHLQLGTSGMINAFIAGSFYHALMLTYKRNLWYSIFCHAIFDTIAITFIYDGYW